VLFIYYSVALLALLVAGPFLLLKKKARAGIGQKLGIIPAPLYSRLKTKARPIWFHAVSVGEFNAVWPLIERFHQKHPELQLVISTTTATGQKIAQDRASSFAEIIYFPLDLPWIVSKWLEAIDPSLVCIVETELWPGFLHQCSKRQIPVMVINGRMSPRSFRRYASLKSFFAPVLRRYTLIAAQSKSEAERYKAIAGDDIPVHIVGNLKFDQVQNIDSAQKHILLKRFNLAHNEHILVAGSTHEGEESALIQAYTTLATSNPQNDSHSNLRLVLVPRHPERFERVAQLIEAAGFNTKRFSRNEGFQSAQDILLVDAIGHLASIYSIATVAFVGGTLIPIGGHNLLEPYAYSIPVVCGSYVHKTQEVADALCENDTISIVKDPAELLPKITELLGNPSLRARMGVAGNRWLLHNVGAVDRTLTLIESLLFENQRNSRSSESPQTFTNKDAFYKTTAKAGNK
jgi:3-deoxy-D-manno-octulosonic-acid transferase